MSAFRWLTIAFLVGAIVLVSMRTAASIDESSNMHRENQLEAKLLEIASKYKGWGRVDDETRWAPWLCRMPMPSIARFSESGDVETHGDKLYYLFAKDRGSYVQVSQGGETETGQVVVKESWHPEVTDRELSNKMWEDWSTDPVPSEIPEDRQGVFAGLGGTSYPFARKDGKIYEAKNRAGLYIMWKTDGDMADTDNGWLYGTVTADGRTVTSAGLVDSCMACHRDAPYDRLFGLPAN